MRLTTKNVDGDWQVQGLKQVVTICRTGPSDEPWHIRVGVCPETETWGQEATKRECLEVVGLMLEAGTLE